MYLPVGIMCFGMTPCFVGKRSQRMMRNDANVRFLILDGSLIL